MQPASGGLTLLLLLCELAGVSICHIPPPDASSPEQVPLFARLIQGLPVAPDGCSRLVRLFMNGISALSDRVQEQGVKSAQSLV